MFQDIQEAVNAQVEAERRQFAGPDPDAGPHGGNGQDPDAGQMPSAAILEALAANEDGDARLYVDLHRGRLVYDMAAGRWFTYTGHTWQKDTLNEAARAVDAAIDLYGQEAKRQAWLRVGAEKAGRTAEAKKHREKEDALLKRIRTLQTVARKENVLTLAHTGAASLAITGLVEWDRDPWLFGCPNGAIDLRTGELRPGVPEDYIRLVTTVFYSGLITPAPVWEKFLWDIFNGDVELIDFMQRLFGYCMTATATEHKAPILFGQGRNGKSTLVEAVRFIFGDYAGTIESEMLLQQKYGRHSGGPSPDIMALRGKRFVVCSETESGRHFNVSRLKWLCGGDTLIGREVYGKELVTFAPTHTLILSTNNKPHASADDYAFWKRALLIPFTLSFVDEPHEPHERKADPGLLDKLKAEASGVLAWCVRGCLEWQRKGLLPPESVKAATAEYQEEEDLIKHFLDDRCLLGADLSVRAGRLYKDYKSWCEEMGHKPMSGTNFGTRIKRRFDHVKDRSGAFYFGLDLAGV